jgi:hypothetical protein
MSNDSYKEALEYLLDKAELTSENDEQEVVFTLDEFRDAFAIVGTNVFIGMDD